jgi:hypothetical protein
MVDVLQSLIDKQDGFEVVRDQIAAILVAEVSNQMSLAATALKDPLLWKLRIYTERSNPWEQFQVQDVDDKSPIVNIWYESSTFPEGRGDVFERQQATGRFNIDVIAYGEASNNPAGGHEPGDLDAALNLARALRLVRNILMAGQNAYLQLQGDVGFRWPESITQYQPEGTNASQIAAARIIFRADFNEFAPQYEGEILELVSAEVIRKEDGEVVLTADYEYPLTP